MDDVTHIFYNFSIRSATSLVFVRFGDDVFESDDEDADWINDIWKWPKNYGVNRLRKRRLFVFFLCMLCVWGSPRGRDVLR